MSVPLPGGLLVALAGMVVLDLRFRLFFRRNPVRAAIVLAVGVLFFLAWDLVGHRLGIFFRGSAELLTGIRLAPELPLEELFFLTLLGYLTMNGYGWLTRLGDGWRAMTYLCWMPRSSSRVPSSPSPPSSSAAVRAGARSGSSRRSSWC